MEVGLGPEFWRSGLLPATPKAQCHGNKALQEPIRQMIEAPGGSF